MHDQAMKGAKNMGVPVADSNKGKESYDIADSSEYSVHHRMPTGSSLVPGGLPRAMPQPGASRGQSFSSVGADGGQFANRETDPAAQARTASMPGKGKNTGLAIRSVAE